MNERELRALQGDLEVEYQHFQSAVARVAEARHRLKDSPDDMLIWYSLAYLIHNLYNSCEAYFLRVSKAFENSLPQDEWHRSLVDRMTVSVTGYRPALLEASDRTTFHELRAFRHLVRHLYDRDIDPQRVQIVTAHLETAIGRFPTIHSQFDAKLQRMAELSEAP